jgi:hypothetical protein
MSLGAPDAYKEEDPEPEDCVMQASYTSFEENAGICLYNA